MDGRCELFLHCYAERVREQVLKQGTVIFAGFFWMSSAGVRRQ